MARAKRMSVVDPAPFRTSHRSPKPKRASALADLIEMDILKSGWPVGQILGSEPDLVDRYEVSRAVFREAVRLLEQREVAEMRRGPGGGLIITAPEASAVQRAASTLLRYQKVDVTQLIDARVDIELACLQLAIDRLDEDDVAFLRTMIEEEAQLISGDSETRELRNFHVELASMSRNKPMSLFVSILTELQAEFSPQMIGDEMAREGHGVSSTDAGASHRAHAAIVDAIVTGDVALAVHRMRRHLNAISEFSTGYVRQPRR